MNSEDDGYVHRPGAARDGDDEPADDAQGANPDDAPGAHPDDAQGAHPEDVERSLGGRGWVLVAVLAFSLLGAPLLILFRPPSLPYWVALLALPMLPAIVLGAVGVWATTRP